MNAFKLLAVAGLAFLLTSCDLSQVPALNGGRLSKEDSKAIGAACRHAGRALEDCFMLNPKTHQAGVFEGWREMNDYMASNKLDTVAPEIPPKLLKKSAATDHESSEEKATGQTRVTTQADQVAPTVQIQTQTQAENQAQSQVQTQSQIKSRPWERRKQDGTSSADKDLKSDPKNHT